MRLWGSGFSVIVLACALALPVAPILSMPAHAQTPAPVAVQSLDAAREVALAKYDASVTQAAYLREADAALGAL